MVGNSNRNPAASGSALDQLVLSWSATTPLLHFTFVSQASVSVTGFSPEDWTQNPDLFLSRVPLDDQLPLTQLLENLPVNTNRAVEHRFLHRDDRVLWLQTTVRKTSDGGIHGVSTDVTSLVDAKLQADRARGELHDFFMRAPAPMMMLSGRDYRYTLANDPYRRMVNRQDLVGKRVYDLFTEAEIGSFIRIVDEVYDTGKPFNGKELPLFLNNEDGTKTERILNVGYYPSYDADGRIHGILAMHIDVTDEVKARRFLENAKKAVEIERANFLNLFKQTPEMVCILRGPDHVFEFVNEAHIRALGFDATGLSVRAAQPDSVAIYDILDDVYRTGKTAELHEIPVSVTGRLRYFNLTYSARRDENGEVNGIMILGTEVTGEVQTRELLRESQERLQFALSSAKMGTWEVHLPSGKVVLSEEAQKIFGFDKEYSTSDIAIDILIHPEDREHARKALNDAITNRSLYDDEYRIQRPDGEIRWLNTRGRAIENPDGTPSMLTGVTVDITERKHQAQSLEQKTGLLETIIEHIPFGVVFAEAPSGKLIFSNERYRKVWRRDMIPADSIEGYGEYVGFHSDGRPYKFHEWPLARAIRTGEVILSEDVDTLFADGSRGVISLSAAPVRDREGKIIAGVVISEDATDRKYAEERLRSAKEEAERANELKSAFLANMSHEIRTPLAAMIGFADLLRDPDLPNADRATYAEIISRNGEQLSELINDILEFSKVEAGHTNLELASVKPLEIAASVVTLLGVKAKEKDLTLEFTFDPRTPSTVTSDSTRIRQVLVNLIGNAIKFTPSGGVKVWGYGFEKEDVGMIGFLVTDTGIGISAEHLGRIFEAFVQGDGSMTRRFGGTGLGLALSRKLGRALGGDVTVESSSSSGSAFLFTFADHAGAKAAASPSEDKNPATEPVTSKTLLQNMSVLLVDDVEDNRRLISKFLINAGAKVESAENGLEGVEKALNGAFDVVLMDIQMPVLDGYSATERLRKNGYGRPIIAITAHAMSDVRQRCEQAGCTDQLPKPIRPNDLVALVAKHAGRPTGPGSRGAE